MSQRSNALDVMPAAVLAQLRALGKHLAIAHKRRHASRKAWAQRLAVSEPTLASMEKDDPSVSMGVSATALWLVGRSAVSTPPAEPASTDEPEKSGRHVKVVGICPASSMRGQSR